MPVTFSDGEKSSILWDLGCESIEDTAICKYAREQ